MLAHAQKRVADLKERGYAQAGVYDPPGVGGTHVVYVLPYADQPGLYDGLPKDPVISPQVEIWKGIAKPLTIAGMAAVVLASLYHYVTKGPNEVSKELEKEENS